MTSIQAGPIPTRFRSNSVPMPKIEVTLHDDNDKANGADGGDEDKTANGVGSSEDVLITVVASEAAAEAHKRTKSLSMRHGHRKKSIMGNLEVSKLKNFKSFVESKILSKSDRSLAENESGGGGGGSRGDDSIIEKASLSDRRASRTSMQGLEVRICIHTCTVAGFENHILATKSFSHGKKCVGKKSYRYFFFFADLGLGLGCCHVSTQFELSICRPDF